MRHLDLRRFHSKLVATAINEDGEWKWQVSPSYVEGLIVELGLEWCLQVWSGENQFFVVSRFEKVPTKENSVGFSLNRARPVSLDEMTERLGSSLSDRIALDRECKLLREKIEKCLGEGYADEVERKFNGMRKLVRRTHH